MGKSGGQKDSAPFPFERRFAVRVRRTLGSVVPQEDAEPLRTCSIITTEANELVAPYHDRMPVMLPKDKYERWLDAGTDPDKLKEMLVPFPESKMREEPVSTLVNSPKNGPGFVERVLSDWNAGQGNQKSPPRMQSGLPFGELLVWTKSIVVMPSPLTNGRR
jgi:hypothetical protein